MKAKTKDPPQAPRGRARMQMDTSAASNYMARNEEARRVKLARKLKPKKLNVVLSNIYPNKGK